MGQRIPAICYSRNTHDTLWIARYSGPTDVSGESSLPKLLELTRPCRSDSPARSKIQAHSYHN